MDIEKHETENTWTFSKEEFKALLAHASPDEMRPNIHALCLDAENGAAVTTDGHRMLILKPSTKPEAEAGIRCVPLDRLRVFKNIPRGGRISIRPNCQTARVRMTDRNGQELSSAEVYLSESLFPPWQKCVPVERPEKPAESIGLSLEYLSELKHVAKIMGKFPHARVHIRGELDPVVIEAFVTEDSTTITAVVMPVRM